jgi:hypothetical protein
MGEYLLVIHPLVLGAGRKMFAEGVPAAELRLADSKTTGGRGHRDVSDARQLRQAAERCRISATGLRVAPVFALDPALVIPAVAALVLVSVQGRAPLASAASRCARWR